MRQPPIPPHLRTTNNNSESDIPPDISPKVLPLVNPEPLTTTEIINQIISTTLLPIHATDPKVLLFISKLQPLQRHKIRLQNYQDSMLMVVNI